MSPRWNWDSPAPLAASECALPPDQRVGESQFQRLEERLALCLLCGHSPIVRYPSFMSHCTVQYVTPPAKMGTPESAKAGMLLKLEMTAAAGTKASSLMSSAVKINSREDSNIQQGHQQQ
jgi:hypothetical protein